MGQHRPVLKQSTPGYRTGTCWRTTAPIACILPNETANFFRLGSIYPKRNPAPDFFWAFIPGAYCRGAFDLEPEIHHQGIGRELVGELCISLLGTVPRNKKFTARVSDGNMLANYRVGAKLTLVNEIARRGEGGGISLNETAPCIKKFTTRVSDGNMLGAGISLNETAPCDKKFNPRVSDGNMLLHIVK